MAYSIDIPSIRIYADRGVTATRTTTLDLNVELLSRARDVLGTRGIEDTIDAALADVIATDARRKVLEHLRTLDLDADALRRDAWGGGDPRSL